MHSLVKNNATTLIFLSLFIVQLPLICMKGQSEHIPQQHSDVWTIIVAQSDPTTKNNIRQVCTTLRNISSKNNYNIYNCKNLQLSENQKNYAIMLATYKKRYNVVKNLLKHNANIKLKNDLNMSLRDLAQYQQADNSITTLLKKYDAPELTIPHHIIAAFFGDIDYLQECINNPTINWSHTIAGNNAVQLAAKSGQTNAIELLLTHPAAQQSICDLSFEFIFDIAKKYPLIGSLLMSQSQRDINHLTPPNNRMHLHRSAQNDKIDEVQLLLKHPNINIDKHDSEGVTPLYVAAQNGHWNVVKTLCKHNANKNSLFLNGYTPLYIASQNGHTGVVKILLSYPETLLNHVTPNGSTALYVAAQNGHTKIVDSLLSREDIDPFITYRGYSCLYVATQKGNIEVMKLLLEHSPKLVNICTNKQFSPLHVSIDKNHHDGVILLLSTPEINLNIINDNHHTPLDIAYEHNDDKMMQLLKQHGAKTCNELKTQ